MGENLLEEFLEGVTEVEAADGSTYPMALFTRALSCEEIAVVADLMTVGDDLR